MLQLIKIIFAFDIDARIPTFSIIIFVLLIYHFFCLLYVLCPPHHVALGLNYHHLIQRIITNNCLKLNFWFDTYWHNHILEFMFMKCITCYRTFIYIQISQAHIQKWKHIKCLLPAATNTCLYMLKWPKDPLRLPFTYQGFICEITTGGNSVNAAYIGNFIIMSSCCI